MQMLKRLILALIFLAAAPFSVDALTVSPVLFDQTLDPGTSVKGAIRAINDSDDAQTYYLSAQKFVPDGEEGHQNFLPEDDKSGIVSWLRLEQVKIEIPPRGSVEVPWVANVPGDAEPGGHYGAIFFSTRPPGDVEGVGVGAKTGVLLLLNVNGDVREDMELVSFQAILPDGGSWTSRIPIHFQTRVKNTGSVHVLPAGTIEVSGLFGTATVVDANPRRSRSLPAGIRRIDSWWGDELDTARGGFWHETAMEWKNFAIGKYTAQLKVQYGRSGREVLGQTEFWIFPWHVMLIAFGSVVGILLLLKGYNYLIVRSAMRKQKK